MIKNFLSIAVCLNNAFQDINIFHSSYKYFVQNLTWYKQTGLAMDLLIYLDTSLLWKQGLGANSPLDL